MNTQLVSRRTSRILKHWPTSCHGGSLRPAGRELGHRTISSTSQPLSASDEAFASELLKASRSYRPLLFALGTSVGIYAYAADQTNKETIEWSKKIRTILDWRTYPPSTAELTHARSLATRDYLVDKLKGVKQMTSSWSKTMAIEAQRLFVILSNSYLAMPEATRTCYQITAVNVLVFLAWRVPRLQGFMRRHFVHDPLSGRAHTLLTSIFSHQSLLHLGFNSMALLSFGAAFDVVDSQRPNVTHMAQATNRWHFLGFYLGAGLFSSGLSHLISTRVLLPRLVRALSDPLKSSTLSPSQAIIKPSLGASGAIYGIVGMTALALPETNISLIFLPMFHFPISFGFAGMVGLDILGILRGWQTFDHWAHLGGAIAGVTYFYKGPWEAVRAYMWPYRA